MNFLFLSVYKTKCSFAGAKSSITVPDTQTIDVSNFGKLSYIKDKIGSVLSGCTAVVTVKFDQFEIKAGQAITNDFDPIPSTIEDNHTYTAKTSVNFRGLVGINKIIENKLNVFSVGPTSGKVARVLNLTYNDQNYPYLLAVNNNIDNITAATGYSGTHRYCFMNTGHAAYASGYLYAGNVISVFNNGAADNTQSYSGLVMPESKACIGSGANGADVTIGFSEQNPKILGFNSITGMEHWFVGGSQTIYQINMYLKYVDIFVGKPSITDLVLWNKDLTEATIGTGIGSYVLGGISSVPTTDFTNANTDLAASVTNSLNSKLSNGIKLHMVATGSGQVVYDNDAKKMLKIKYSYYI